jgi:hypothetical protein
MSSSSVNYIITHKGNIVQIARQVPAQHYTSPEPFCRQSAGLQWWLPTDVVSAEGCQDNQQIDGHKLPILALPGLVRDWVTGLPDFQVCDRFDRSLICD